MMDRKEYAERFYSRHGRYPCWINYKVEDTKMMIDEQENQYDAQGNSADFARCGDGWALWNEANRLMGVSYPLYVIAWNNYRQHVINCPTCKASKGRFREEVE